MNVLFYVDIGKGICKKKLKNARNEKLKKTRGVFYKYEELQIVRLDFVRNFFFWSEPLIWFRLFGLNNNYSIADFMLVAPNLSRFSYYFTYYQSWIFFWTGNWGLKSRYSFLIFESEICWKIDFWQILWKRRNHTFPSNLKKLRSNYTDNLVRKYFFHYILTVLPRIIDISLSLRRAIRWFMDIFSTIFFMTKLLRWVQLQPFFSDPSLAADSLQKPQKWTYTNRKKQG